MATRCSRAAAGARRGRRPVRPGHDVVPESRRAGGRARTRGAIRVVVAGDDVTRGKPDPEPYLTAAARLGVDPRDCVAIEDSPGGLRSAMAAGAKTIGVPNIVAVDPAPGLSRFPDLLSITLADLAAVHAGEVIDRIGAPVAISPSPS